MTVRQLLLRVLALIVLVLIITSYWLLPLALRPLRFFAVRRVEVTGTRYLAVDDVVEGMGLGPKASVFDDLGSLERRLDAMSGVAHARVTRRLPGTIEVNVTEVEPVALAESPNGLVPLARDATPLPYDVVKAPVDAPIVHAAQRPLVTALATVQGTDLELFADIVSARIAGNEVDLDVANGRVRLDLPVDPEVVRSVSSVRRDLSDRGTEWRELDGRFKGWVVVRRADARNARDAQTRGRANAQERKRAQPARRRPVRHAAATSAAVVFAARLRVCASARLV